MRNNLLTAVAVALPLALTATASYQGIDTTVPMFSNVAVARQAAAEALPFYEDFSTVEKFNNWISVAGPAAAVTSPWKYNSYGAYAEFDLAEDLAEDNWFISQGLSFPEAGNYLLTVTATVYGSLDFCLGTAQNDLSTYRVLLSKQNVSEFGETYEIPFTVDAAGTYYIGFHANAEEGTLMGYRINEVKLKQNLMVPALVTDLKAVSDPSENLSVTLSWTNPTKDQTGGNLDAITKAEVYRNGELIKTLTDGLNIGGAMSVVDTPAQAGVYTYTVKVYNTNGCLDQDPMVASSGYVGHPTASMPFNFNIDNNDDMVPLFTIEDANNDGYTWALDNGYWSKAFMSQRPGDVSSDDYIASPYLNLAKGYYKLNTTVNARLNNYEVGFATDRHNIAATFVKCAEYLDVQEFGANDKSVFIDIPVAGEYVMVVRHVGLPSLSSYPDIKFTRMSLVEQPAIPQQADELSLTNDGSAITLRWNNPTLDVVGNEMDAATQLGYTIKRNDEVIAQVAPSAASLPGAAMTYVDTQAPDGEVTYTLSVSNSFGNANGEPVMASIYCGQGESMPYAATDFADWKLINNGTQYNLWEADETNGGLKWYQYYGTPDEDYALTPYLTFEPNSEYKVVMELTGTSAWALVHGTVAKTEALRQLTTATASADNTIVEIMLTTLPTATADEAGDEARYFVNPGNGVLGIAPTSTGSLNLRSFAVEKTGTVGVETILAYNDGLRYADGLVYFPEGATDVMVCNLSGQVIYTAAVAPAQLELRAEGVLIVRANVKGRAASLKIKR